jgi:hypothetical protein
MSTITIGDFVIGANGEGIAGWAYNNVVGWYEDDQDQLDSEPRPGQNGSFISGESYSSGATPSVEGVFHGSDARAVAQAKLFIRGLKNGGRPVSVIWDDHGVITRRTVFIRRAVPGHSAGRAGFRWAIDMESADPALYGPMQLAGPVNPPTRGEGGLRFDQYTGISYEWTGQRHLSQSVQRNVGVETRRNHAVNPSFEIDTAGWYAGSAVSIERALNVGASTGTACARVTRLEGPNDRIGTALTGLTVGQLYRATAWIKQDGASVNVTMVVDNVLSSPQATTASFIEMNFQFTATAATMNLEMAIYPNAVTGSKFLLDSLRVEKFSTISNPSYYDGDTVGTGAGPGLVFPEVYETSYGENGRLTIVNEGGAESYPNFTVVGGSSLGFTITRVSTGQTIEVRREIPIGSIVKVNMRTGRVSIDGDNDISGSLRQDDWWATAPQSSEQVQFGILGSSYGSPTLTAEYARAD